MFTCHEKLPLWMNIKLSKYEKFKLTVTTVFLIISTAILLSQLITLSRQYHRYDVKIETKYFNEKIIHLPFFSFCFKIMHILNTKRIFQKYPNILGYVKHLEATRERYRNWSYSDIIKDFDDGEDIIFSNLSTSQIMDVLRPIKTIFSECVFLTPNLTKAQCDVDQWNKSLYIQSLCITTSKTRTFLKNSVSFFGYDNLDLLDITLNLTLMPRLNSVIIYTHQHPVIPWYSGVQSRELMPTMGFRISFYFTYQERLEVSAPPPHDSSCRPDDNGSAGLCYDKCLIRPFVNQTKLYPRYSIVLKTGDTKLIYDYGQREKYSSLSSKLYRKCRKLCGTQDCKHWSYPLKRVAMTEVSRFPGKILHIKIFPPTSPMFIRSHKPVISKENFFSSVGGLIGMYFGVSFISLFCQLKRNLTKWINGLTQASKHLTSTSEVRKHSIDLDSSFSNVQDQLTDKRLYNQIPCSFYLTRVNTLHLFTLETDRPVITASGYIDTWATQKLRRSRLCNRIDNQVKRQRRREKIQLTAKLT